MVCFYSYLRMDRDVSLKRGRGEEKRGGEESRGFGGGGDGDALLRAGRDQLSTT